ncbi:MAG: AAA-like domain-containing protein [Nostocaceae cyanobacterium]|nr:AAA-like domain-containing protein [Nostocaceae cyanobacterium]
MNSALELPWSNLQEIADLIVFIKTEKHLTDIEMKVLQGSGEGKTYDEMAIIYGYSAEYLNKDVGNKLWHKLSEALGEKVTKKNFKAALKRAWQQKQSTSSDSKNQRLQVFRELNILPFPEGSLPADSPFYVQRYDIESLCYETIIKPGALIRIKAAKLMGKTSLINQILAQSTQENYRTVYLDLSAVNLGILTNLDKFLRWLCYTVGRQLKLANKLSDYWNTEILGSNDNCTAYFEEYLLLEIDCPLVLALDDVDRIFPQKSVIEDFLGMLRSWHEKAKIYPIWQQLRLIIAHSTEVYIPLDINQSPFNAGVPIDLLEFDQKQVQDLARLHNLNWEDREVEKLISMVGGHPYMVRLAMYEVSSTNLKLEQLLLEATTEAGIYSNHLRGYLEVLKQVPDLAQALKKVVSSPEPVELDSMQIYKLHSMGLVQRQDNHVIPRCNLYREYFQRVLG